jgi:hypothetical protein
MIMDSRDEFSLDAYTSGCLNLRAESANGGQSRLGLNPQTVQFLMEWPRMFDSGGCEGEAISCLFEIAQPPMNHRQDDMVESRTPSVESDRAFQGI